MWSPMTAFHTYYETLGKGQLAAAVPISEGGMATASYNVVSQPAVHAAALSGNPQERAVIAIYACQAVHEAVEKGIVHR